jgi:hypothetical protein
MPGSVVRLANSQELAQMPKPEDLARLNRHVLFSKLASLGVLLFGLICFILYFRPSLAGVPAESLRDYQNVTIWLVAGMILTLLGSAFLSFPLAGRANSRTRSYTPCPRP